MVDLCLILNLSLIVKFLAKHLSYQLYSRKLLNLIFSDQFTIPKNRNPVTYFIYLIQKVRNEDDSYASGFQILHKPEEFLYLFVIQRGGRLIEDQYFTIHIYGSGDGNHLLDCDRTAGKLLRCLCRNIERLQNLICVLVHFLPILSHTLRSSDKHVLCNGQVRAEGNFLIHSTDSQILRILRRMDFYRLVTSCKENFSLIFFIHTGQDLDQCRFSGSVLTHKCVDFSFTQGEINRLQCLYSCKVFMDIFHL